MISSGTITLLLITAVVLASAAAGVRVSSAPGTSVRLVPFSGGVLVGISLCWVLPEIAGGFGWIPATGWLVAGFALLWLIDRFVYPVCPTCAHAHDHDECSARLHGFAAPLVTAAALHSLLDGLGIAVSQDPASGELGRAVFWGIALHKVPEGLALGVMLRASLRSWQGAMAGCLVAQLPMLAGGMLEALAAPYMDGRWMVSLLALAGGSFLYLGYHAVHSEWKRKGAVPAFVAALGGGVVAAVLHQGLTRLSSWNTLP